MTEVMREIPQAIEIEMSVLASFMADKETFDKYCGDIVPDMFYRTDHRTIYEYMVESNSTDIILLANRFPDKRPILSACMQAASYVNLCAQIDVLRDKWMRRCIVTTAQQAIMDAENDYDRKAESIAEEVIGKMALNETDASSPEHIGTIIPRALDELRDFSSSGSGIGTGIADIDDTAGLMYPGDYVIIAGRPGTGKSSLMASMLINVSETTNKPSLVFSLEMSKCLTTNRILFAKAGANIDLAINHKMGHERETASAEIAGNKAENWPIYIDDKPAAKISRIASTVERYKKSVNIALVFVDHMQLMGTTRGRSRNEEIAEISVGLKNIARKNNLVVIGLSQLSRSVESRHPPMPILSDLRDSGSIEQDADKVIFLYKEKSKDGSESVSAIIAKNRNGKTGRRYIKWLAESMRFESTGSTQW